MLSVTSLNKLFKFSGNMVPQHLWRRCIEDSITAVRVASSPFGAMNYIVRVEASIWSRCKIVPYMNMWQWIYFHQNTEI